MKFRILPHYGLFYKRYDATVFIPKGCESGCSYWRSKRTGDTYTKQTIARLELNRISHEASIKLLGYDLVELYGFDKKQKAKKL